MIRMKLSWVVVALILAVSLFVTPVMSEEKKGMMGGHGMMCEKMMGEGMMGGKMPARHNMMQDTMGMMKEMMGILKDMSHAPGDAQKKRLEEMMQKTDEMMKKQDR